MVNKTTKSGVKTAEIAPNCCLEMIIRSRPFENDGQNAENIPEINKTSKLGSKTARSLNVAGILLYWK